MKGALVFLGMAVTDFLWGRYIIATASDKAALAATFSSMIVGVSSLVTLAYVAEPWYILFAMGGAAVGTVLAVRRG